MRKIIQSRAKITGYRVLCNGISINDRGSARRSTDKRQSMLRWNIVRVAFRGTGRHVARRGKVALQIVGIVKDAAIRRSDAGQMLMSITREDDAFVARPNNSAVADIQRHAIGIGNGSQ